MKNNKLLGVFRPAKGDLASPVNGMLHKSDISESVLQALRAQMGPPTALKLPGPKPLIEKNTPITVYVKEVYKQSG